MEKNLELEDFLEVEKKYHLYEDTIDGVYYWIYSRFIIWEDIIIKSELKLDKAHNNKALNYTEKLIIFLKLLYNSLFKSWSIPKNIDILFVSHPRRVLNQKEYECIYTDKLAERFENSLTYELPYQWKHQEPLYTSRIFYGDKTLLKKGIYLALYKTFLKGKYKKLLERIGEKIKEPLEEIEGKYGFLIHKDEITRTIATQIIFYKASSKDIKKLLNKLKPKVVIETIGYNPMCMLINEICKKIGITTIELQHGTMNKHMAYKYVKGSNILQFPDKIFLFSEYWKKEINVPIADENLIATGYPFFERKLQEAKIIPEYQDEKINILFISQGTIGSRLSQLASELSDICDTSNYRILYKLHPGEFGIWREKYQNLLNSNVIVIAESKYSIYDFFATCRIQVGVYSTALYEGLGFGLATFIYETEMSGHMKKLNESGYVTYVKNCEELMQYISNRDVLEISYKNFWEVDSLNKMVNNIKGLL